MCALLCCALAGARVRPHSALQRRGTMFSAADSWELESSTAAPLLISEPQDFVLGRNADCLKLLPALDQRVSDEGKSVSRRQATLRLAADASELILTSQSKSNRTGVRRGASSEWNWLRQNESCVVSDGDAIALAEPKSSASAPTLILTLRNVLAAATQVYSDNPDASPERAAAPSPKRQRQSCSGVGRNAGDGGTPKPQNPTK